MKKNLLFLKNIVNSDFSVVHDNLLNKAAAPVKTTFGYNKVQDYAHLNLLVLNKSLKQFLRTVQYLKKRRHSTLTIYIKDLHFSSLLYKLLGTSQLKTRIFIKNSLKKIEKPKIRRNLILLLDVEFSDTAVLKQFVENSFFLINKINTSHEIINSGTFKIFNDVKELKKMIFLILLLKKTLNK